MNDAKKIRSKSMAKAKMIGVLVALGIVVASALYWYMTYTNSAPLAERNVPQTDGNLQTTTNEEIITSIAENVSPSVVSIVTNVTTQTIFGAAQGEAAGTGIIVSKDGYVLTNKHVVSGADKVEVILSNGTSYTNVTVVGSDPLNDIAFLKINGVNNLSPAELGDSATTRVGQEVVAIGNSLGQYQTTVTSGIISGKGRPITAGSEGTGETESLTDLLQTDAAINPGNSGGPLLNRSGQVIGVNTAVAANAQGIGFAIPINATKGALKQVLAGKGVERSYLGLRYVTLTPDVAKQYDVSVTQGAYIVGAEGRPGVLPGSPADKAGLREKDIIKKVNGMMVGPQGGVSSLIGEYAPGDTVSLLVLRDGRELTLKATLQAYSD
ncbi:hypothetical protein B7Z00_02125 [Candidatus Saccharibacteria bacterium 32-50-10]|nr:MAG: hypothetical protein B7Z00_02125 [Candidatus Saccharibacteria bacterium 32-50-10]